MTKDQGMCLRSHSVNRQKGNFYRALKGPLFTSPNFARKEGGKSCVISSPRTDLPKHSSVMGASVSSASFGRLPKRRKAAAHFRKKNDTGKQNKENPGCQENPGAWVQSRPG